MLKNILIFGCGSIGQRHAINAKKIGIEKIILFDIDQFRLKEFAQKIGTKFYYCELNSLFEENPFIQAAIISTPSSLHVSNAKLLAEHNINLFIEKPLSNTLEGIEELESLVEERELIIMMGQSYRFHEGFKKLKEFLNNYEIGKIFHVNYFGGQYLPDWHPEMDYREEYSARKELGGGVLLTTMSHMFDNIQWLFGEIVNIEGFKGRLSDLEIDVEDSVFLLIRTNKCIIINTSFDFLQRCPQHKMVITGSEGHIEADFISHNIKICKDQSIISVSYNFDSNRRYIDELLHFVYLVENRINNHKINLKIGKKALECIFHPNILDL